MTQSPEPDFLGGLPGIESAPQQPERQPAGEQDFGSVLTREDDRPPKGDSRADNRFPDAAAIRVQDSGSNEPLNKLALISFIGSFFASLVGIICGHLALRQIKRDGGRGRGFALAGTIIGYVGFVFSGLLLAGIISTATVAMNLTMDALPVDDSAAKAAAEIAEGIEPVVDEDAPHPGGGVEGYELSGPFCEALTAAAAVPFPNLMTSEVPSEVISAFETVASIESPSQKVYQEFAGLLADPTLLADEAAAQSIVTAFVDAAQADAMVCS